MRILSGIQPTGKVHIGNYLGALSQWVLLQEKGECFFFIADLHSLTVPYQRKKLKELIFEKVIILLGAGIDPKKSTIFLQSQIPYHTELAWLLSTVTSVGDLLRMHQFKEKKRKKKFINAGLLNYPILMASDILLYQTDLVPVGKDQLQHIELTREIAKRFNRRFGKTFKVPKASILKMGAKIASLTNPLKKMSKSDSEESYISLLDSPADIKRKIKKAVTDPGKEIKYDPLKKPGISNLLIIYSLFSKRSIKSLEKEFKGKGYEEFKEKLANLLIEKLKVFRSLKNEIKEKEIKEILKRGKKRAEKISQKTILKVKKKMGLI